MTLLATDAHASRADLVSGWACLEIETRGRDRAEAHEMMRAFLDGLTEQDVIDACRDEPSDAPEATGSDGEDKGTLAATFRRLLGARLRHQPPDAATIIERLSDLTLGSDCHTSYLRAAQRRVDVFTGAEADAIARVLLALSDENPDSETDFERCAVPFGRSDAVLARLATYLTSSSDRDRRRGAELARESRDDRVAPLLLGALERAVHDALPFRESLDAVAVAAAEKSGGDSIAFLAQLIGANTDWRIQRAGIVALGHTDEPRAFRELARLHRESASLVRHWPSEDDLSTELHRSARRLESAGTRALRHGLVAEARDVVDVLDYTSRVGPCVRPKSVAEALKDYLHRDPDADPDRIRAIVERVNAS